MNTFIFIVLICLCLGIFIKSFAKYDELLQFPFLITCDLLIFIGPQMYYLLRNKSLFIDYGELSFFTFAVICIIFYISAILGYYSKKITFKIPSWNFNKNVLIAGLFILSMIAVYGRVQLAALPKEMTSMGQWTGLPVRYLFFVTVGNLCIPLGIVLYFKYKQNIILIPLLLEFGSIASMVIFGGRRTPALFAGLMVLTGLWFSKRLKIPTGIILGAGLVFIMFVANAGTYRYLLSQESVDWKQVTEEVFSIKKTVEKFTGGEANRGNSSDDLGNYVDVLNGLVCSQAAFVSFKYNYGSALWNDLVHSWVPGQLVGHDFKQKLKLEAGNREKVATEIFKYKWHVGSCIPGYAEVFAAFGFLGVFLMYQMGKIARVIWEQALTGNLIAQTCHFALAPMYVRFGGGGLWPLLVGLFFWVIFLAPIYIIAKRKA